jgi:pimeloyl-ACP methyl ester carboxylesterase
MNKPTYHSVNVDGLDVFYRKAGDSADPILLLLHGFPTSSHMFRDLIPLLSDRFQVVAPDLPGFGRTALPSRDKFNYTPLHRGDRSFWSGSRTVASLLGRSCANASG